MVEDFILISELRVINSVEESHRFGISVGRLSVARHDKTPDANIVKMCAESQLDAIILRVPAERTKLAGLLIQQSGLRILHADSLLYYEWNLKMLKKEESSRQFEIRNTSDLEDLSGVFDDAFAGYHNHYSSNPWFARHATLESYKEWAQNVMTLPTSRVFACYECLSDLPLGFVLVRLASVKQTAEVVLNGVVSSHRRMGVYSFCMLKAAESLNSAENVERLYISTQTTNNSVISAWEKLGLRFGFALNTYHVMRM